MGIKTLRQALSVCVFFYNWVGGTLLWKSIIATIAALVSLCCHIVSLCSHQGLGVVFVLFFCKASWPPFSPLVGGPGGQLISARGMPPSESFYTRKKRQTATNISQLQALCWGPLFDKIYRLNRVSLMRKKLFLNAPFQLDSYWSTTSYQSMLFNWPRYYKCKIGMLTQLSKPIYNMPKI